MKKIVLFLFAAFAFIAAVKGQSLPTLIPYFDGDKWGYADSNGKVMIKPQWRLAYFFNNGRADVYTEYSRCVIDEHGTYIIPPYRSWNGQLYPSIIGAYYNAMGETAKYGIIDSNNHELLPCLYDRTDAGNGFTVSGFFKWDETQKKYIAKVSKNGKFGVVDTSNHTLIPFEYDGIDIDGYPPFSSPKYYVVQKNGKMGIIDRYNHTIIPPKYRNVWLDEHDDNQIMLYNSDRASVIADTTGKIIWDIPGYTLGFPRKELVPVMDSAGKWGLMNHDRKSLIPCKYLGTWFQHDTVVISKWCPDSVKNQVQCFKYYNAKTLREMSGWVNYQQYANLPDKVVAPTLNSKLPHYLKLHIKGTELDEYKKGDIVWSAVEYPKWPECFTPVRGIDIHDSIARYAAIIDSNGNYVVAPVITNNKLKVINAIDSLVIVESNKKDSFQSVTDFHLKPLLPFQQYVIANAFYCKGTFYAIATHDYKHTVYWHSFEGGGESEAHDYTYYLITADGKPAKGIGSYKLHGYTDSNGRLIKSNRYASDDDDKFDVSFKGYFLVEDSMERRGIVDVYGQVQLPALSFKYRKIISRGPDVFLVDNSVPEPRNGYYNDLFGNAKEPVEHNETQLLRGFPYVVNRDNKVLLDSLSVTYVSDPGDTRLYYITLRQPTRNYSGKNVCFYMDDKGIAYHGVLPDDKKSIVKPSQQQKKKK